MKRLKSLRKTFKKETFETILRTNHTTAELTETLATGFTTEGKHQADAEKGDCLFPHQLKKLHYCPAAIAALAAANLASGTL